jgi:hypothetical protein
MNADTPRGSTRQAPPAPVRTPVDAPRCPSCPGHGRPDREPVLMGGTGIVEVQRWRCALEPSHWWDDFRAIVDL